MNRFAKWGLAALVLALTLSTPEVHAAKKKKAKVTKASERKPASAGKGFKVKVSGEFTRVTDDEKGIVCYFAKRGGGSCVKLPR